MSELTNNEIKATPDVAEGMQQAFSDATQAANLAAEIYDEVNRQLPSEKARAEAAMDRTAEEMKNEFIRPHHFDGAGQPIGSIPREVYHRWNQLYPGCWNDGAFKEEFLADNPRCRHPGYKPKAKTLYFDMGGKPVVRAGAQLYHKYKNFVAGMAIGDTA